MEPISVKEFNKMQDQGYADYVVKCTANGVNPEPQSRYFPKVGVNYGYVVYNRFNEITWKKRKSDFN